MTASHAFLPAQAAPRLAALAEQGVYLGTSSWKYPGWRGQLYTDDRYTFRGRFAEKRFENACLEEYAGVFHTVGVDATYYRFPDARLVAALASQVPPTFKLSFKVTDEVTLKRFTRLPRFGPRAGQPNPGFLDASLFTARFLAPCEPFRDQIGVLMFEFSRFYPADFERGRDFLEALGRFLDQLPRGWRYGVEIRNRHFLQPEYFALLAAHGVAHVFNSWEGMPSLAEQQSLASGQPHANFTAARLLLRPGRDYEAAVRQFSPYREIQDPYPEGRAAAVRLIQDTLTRRGPSQAFLYVNNRFEGNALQTISALLAGLADPGIPGEAVNAIRPAPGTGPGSAELAPGETPR